MIRIAIPVFQKRVSPVLDSCSRLLIVCVNHATEVERQEMFLDSFSLDERFKLIQKAKIDVIICCGISQVLHHLLSSGKIKLVCGIIGDVERVLAAFLDNRLDHPSFRMPGYRATD